MRIIGGRKCEIHQITSTESINFLRMYHLQNSASASIHLGCYYNDELLGVMTFGTPRFDSSAEYELIRLCWKPDTVVIGGTAKLFKYFTSKLSPKSIITYCDIGKFSGKTYSNLGFSRISITEPNYVWVNPQTNDVLTRYQTMKHKLVEHGLGNQDQTEAEIMRNLGYIRVHDSGNIKFEWKAGKGD